MKHFFYLRKLLFILFPAAACLTLPANGQVTVTGGTAAAGSYTTLATAVTAVNGFAASGNIVIDVLAGHTETSPAGGISLGSTLLNNALAAGPYSLTIQKNGTGANPVINAYAGGTGTPTTAVQDGIFQLVGTDNVTVDGIDLSDGNTAGTAFMEYGYGLFKLSAGDGCQNNTIKNCTITLSYGNNASGGTLAVDGSRGINMVNALPSAQTTVVTPSSILGTNSGNKFYGNTIQNCNVGMALIGYAAPSPFILADKNNDIGGTAAMTGNLIQNFGGAPAAANPAAGIRTLAQYDLNVSYNTLVSNNGSGTNHPTTLRGIYLNTATSASSTVTFNTITVTGGGTTAQLAAIENASGATAFSNTVNISNNTIANCSYPTATSGTFFAIYNNGATVQNLTINNNLLTGNSTHATSGTFYNIYNSAAVPGNISYQNNVIDIATFHAAVSSSITLYNLYTSAAGTAVISISNNTLRNLVHNGSTGYTGTCYNIYVTGTAAASLSIQNNNYDNITLKGTGSFYFIYVPGNASLNSEISGNHITGGWTRTPATTTSGTVYLTYCYSSNSSPTSGTSINYHDNDWQNVNNALSSSTMYGIFCGGGETCNIYNNTLNNISGGAGTLYLMYGPYYYQKFANCYNNTFSNINYGGNIYCMYFYQYYTQASNTYNNTWSNITTSGANLYGLYIYYTGGGNAIRGPYNFYNNRLTDLTNTNTTGIVRGINEYYRYYGGTVNVYNNLIGNLFAPNSSNDQAVVGIRLQPYSPGDGSTMISNYSYNTVYLTGSSASSGFGTSAFNADNYTSGSTTFRTDYTLKNNIFINKTVPTGSGLAVGHRLLNAAYNANFNGASNNNLWYVAAGPGSLYYYDGTSSDATFAAYQSRVTTRENASQSEDVDFVSVSGTSASFLKPVGYHSFVESYAVNIPGIEDDYAGTIRQGNAGYLGSGTAPDIGAWEINGTQPPICSGTPSPGTITGSSSVCANSNTTLSLDGGNSADLFISYQWKYSTTAGGPYTNLGTFATQPTGPLTVPTYYICTLTCNQPGGGSSTTPEKSVGIIAQPIVSTSISTALFCGNVPANYTVTASGADTYLWSPSTGLTGGVTNPTVTLAPAASTIYTVTGTETSTGCTNTATVFANRATAVTLQATATPNNVCPGGSASLGAIAAFAGNYCTTSISSSTADEEILNVTVGSLDQSSLCGTVAPGPGSIAYRYSNYMSGAGAPASPNLAAGSTVSYSLTFTYCGTGTFSNQAAIYIDFDQNGSFADAGEEVYYKAYASFSYPTQVFTGSFTVPSGAFNGPTRMRVVLAETSTRLTGCLAYSWGETEDYLVNITGGVDNSLVVNWSPSTYLNSGTGNSVTASGISNSIVYTATTTSASGCTATDTAAVISGNMAVSVTSTDVTLCQLESAVLTASVISGAGPYSYSWFPGGETTSSITVSPMNTTTYSCTVTSQLCGDNDVQSFTINVEPVPVLTLNSEYSVYCYGSATPVSLTASGDGTSYAWSPATGLSATNTAAVAVSGLNNTQTYQVVSTLGNCSTTKSTTVRVPGPIYTDATATPASICLYSIAQLNATSRTSATYSAFAETPAPVLSPGSGVVTLDNSTAVTTGDFDEGYWQVSLPFRFGLFDEGYNTVYINTDGYVNFNGAPITYTRTAIPSASSPNASVFLAWKDWNMTASGSIEYFTSGIAPHRVFVIKYIDVPPYSGTGVLNGQIELYEDGNVALFLATTDGSSTKTLGLESADGLTVQTFSTRNGVPWTVSAPEMWRFTTTGGSLTYAWTPSSLLVSPSSAVSETVPLTVLPATFNVTISDTSGCMNTDSVTIIEGLSMVANILTPNTTICDGTTITLTAQVLGGGQPYSFTWDDGSAIFNGPGPFQSVQVTPPVGNTTYNVTVTDQCTGIPATGSLTIHVNALPAVSITPSGGGSACGSDSLTLVASGTSSSYSWSPASGLNTTTGNTVKAQPAAMGSTIIYTVTGTNANGCQNIASAPVKHALPVTVTASALPTDVCSGGNSQLNALATVPNEIVLGAYYTSSYYYGPGYFASSTSNYWSKSAAIYTAAEIAAAGGGAGNITRIAYNKVNNSTYSGAATFQIWMKHVNYSTYSSSTNSFATLTSGATLVYSSSAQSLDGTIGWIDFDLQTPFTWNGSDNIQVITAYYKPSGTIATPASVLWQYAYTGTSNYWNAYAYSTVQSSTANLSRIYYRPVIQLTFPVGFSYSWSPSSFLNSTTVSNPVVQNITSSTNYSVTVTSDDGCSAVASAAVEVKPLSATASASSGTVCQDSSVTLTATGDGGGPPYVYTWKEGSTVIGSGATITVTPDVIGSHAYTVYIDDICGSPTAQSTVTVNEVAKPNVTVTKSGDICGSGSVTLTASGTNIYVWSPAQSLSSATSAITTASPTVTTAYVVYGTSLTTGCTSISDPVTVYVHLLPDVTATATPNPILLNANTQLQANVTQNSNYGYTVQSIPYSGRDLTAVAGISGGAGDEPNTNMPLGFDFNFFGNTYTGVTFHGNGQILMGLNNASANSIYSPPSSGIPTAAAPNNWLGYWVDQYTDATNQVQWGVVGAAPNRKLIVRAISINYYFSTPANTYQYELWEGSNYIDVYMTNNSTTSTLYRQIGIENETGTLGTFAPGRNYGQWTAANEAWRFAPVTFGAPSFTYNWSPSIYLDDTTIASPYATSVGAVTTYTVNVTNTTTGCAAVPATIQVLAGVDLTVDATSPDTVVCLGGSSTLNSVVTGGGVPYQYSWSDGSTVISTESSVTVTPSVTTTYFLTVTDVGNAALTAPITVVVNPLPEITVTPPGGSICNSTTGISLTASGNSNSYGWTPSAGLSSITAPTVTANPAVTTTYVVTGTIFATGCKNTASVTIYKVNLAVNAFGSPYSVCFNQNGQLNSTAVNTLSSYSVESIPFSDMDLSTLTQTNGPTGDEGNTTVNLGFTFNYFGNNYTAVTIHSNGQILMGANNTSANNIYTPPTAFPSTAAPNNWCGFWADLNPSTAQITYDVLGTAPYRKLVVRFTNVNYWSATPAVTYQIELNETTNYIDMFVTSTTSGGNNRVLGIENSTGTVGTIAPGRTYGLWNAANEAWRFAPAAGFTYSWSPTIFLNDPTLPNPTITALTDTTIYTLSVTDPTSGCQLSDTARINAVPLPQVSVSGTQGVCVGSSANLTFTFTGLAPFTYTYTDGINTYGPLTSAGYTATVPVTPAGIAGETFTYVPASVSDARCSGTPLELGGSATLTMLALSSGDGLSVTSNKAFNNICSGDPITITLNGISSTSLGYQATWKWYSGSCGGTLVPGSTGKTAITVSPTTNTTYFVRAEGYCNNTACLSIPVVVSTNPPSGNPALVYSPAIAFAGATDSLIVNPIPGAIWYRWSNGGNTNILFDGHQGPWQTTSNKVNLTFISPSTQGNGIGNYHISMFAGNACGRTNTNNLQIRSTVSAPAAITGPDVACVGQTRTYSIPSITGAKSYDWSFTSGGGTITGNGTTVVNVTFSSLPATLCVHGVSAFNTDGPNLCLTITTNISTPGAITGNPTPCQGTTTAYSIAPVTGAVSYAWSTTIPGATVSGTTSSANITFPAGTFSGDICVSANSGCGFSAPSCLAVINGAPAPIGTISGPTEGLCGVTGVNYQIPATGDTIYTWVVPSGAVVTSGQGTNSILVNFGSSFAGGNITINASNACGTVSGMLAVSGAPASPTITGATLVCAEDVENYIASSSGATSYTWSMNPLEGTIIPTGNQNEILVEWITNGGTISVAASNACGTSSQSSVLVGSSCRLAGGDPYHELRASVFPNPSNGRISLQITTEESTKYVVKVMDLTGRLAHSEHVSTDRGLNNFEIDITSLAKGMYNLSLESEKGNSIVFKIITE